MGNRIYLVWCLEYLCHSLLSLVSLPLLHLLLPRGSIPTILFGEL